ncbi:MAG: tRNA threonylcarbamoyladenosine dehydratase [Spirochaetales bacterium]|nr:tRNA threonylcarbamoyladenosine dehydratase [Spirochaetales bacterium]
MERFSRTEKLLGTEKLLRLQASSAVLFGAGAVGSFAAEALVRSGIGSLIIVDYDDISLSNINRQLFALESTLGQNKVDTAIARLLDINPKCRLTGVKQFADVNTIPEILKSPPDIVLDAIDTVDPKLELLTYCARSSIPVISSMGAARKTDPLAVRVDSLFKSAHCPLARLMRKYLRRRGIKSGITCVYSTEPPLPPRPGEDSDELSGTNHSTKIMGSLTTITGIFGLVLADTAMKIITGDY